MFEPTRIPDQAFALSCEEDACKVTDIRNRTDKTCAIGTVRVYSAQQIHSRSDGEDGVN